MKTSTAVRACLLAGLGAACRLFPQNDDLVLSDAAASRLVADAREFLEKQKQPWVSSASDMAAGLPPAVAKLTLARQTYDKPIGFQAHDGHLDIDFMNGNDVRIGVRIYKAGVARCPGDMPTRYKDLFWYNLNTDLPPEKQNCP